MLSGAIAIQFIKKEEKKRKKKSLIIPLYFTRDRKKKLDIEILPSHNIYEIERLYSADYFNYKPKEDPEKHFEFVLVDKNNRFNDFIINDYFEPFKLLNTHNFDLFYLQLFTRTHLNAESTVNQYYKVVPIELNRKINDSVRRYKIKNDNLYKFSKKSNSFIKIAFTLNNDSIEIKKKQRNIFIPILNLISIDNYKEKNDYYQPLRIRFSIVNKIKDYIIGISKKEYLIWDSLIHQQFEIVKKIHIFNEGKEEINKISRIKRSLLVQLMNKNNTIEWNISNVESRQIFCDEINDENLKLLINYISDYKKSILFNQFNEAFENLNKLIDLLSNNKNLYEKEEDYEFLVDTYKKYKEIILKSNENNNLYNKFKVEIPDSIYIFCYNKYLTEIDKQLSKKKKDIKISNKNLSLFYENSTSDLINLNYCVPISV